MAKKRGNTTVNPNMKRRRLSFDQHIPITPLRSSTISKSIDTEDDLTLADKPILKTTWQMYRVSPLFGFDEKKLKIYSKKMSEGLAALGYSSGKSCSYKSVFKSIPWLKKNEKSKSGLEIQVFVGGKNTTKPNYKAYLFAWAESPTTQNDAVVSLPLLFVQSTLTLSAQVHKLLCKFFDCDIAPLILPHDVLMSLVLLNFEVPDPQEKDESSFITFHYAITHGSLKNKITLVLSFTAMAAITLLIKENTDLDETKRNTVVYDKLLHHLNRLYEINLNNAQLIRVDNHDVMVSIVGRLLVRDEEYLKKALDILSDFAVLLKPTNDAVDEDNED